MTPTIFYVKDRSGNLVAAKFLFYNGSYQSDPNKSTAQTMPIFTASGTPIADANPDGYLIVPADYSVGAAIQAGGVLQDTWHNETLGVRYGYYRAETVPQYLSDSGCGRFYRGGCGTK